MPILLAWKDPERKILIATFSEIWTLEEYAEMVVKGATMMSQEPHTVHVIYDFTRNIRPPHQFIRAGYHAESVLPENQGIVVFVAANTLIQATLGMGRRLNLKCTRYVHLALNMDMALSLIDEKVYELRQSH